VLCVKPAPEQQRLDDAIGFLRDHAEVRIAEFQFLFSPPFPSPSLIDKHLPFSCIMNNSTHVATVSRSRDINVHMSVAPLADYSLSMIIHCDKVSPRTQFVIIALSHLNLP